jgi:hypothetical protein
MGGIGGGGTSGGGGSGGGGFASTFKEGLGGGLADIAVGLIGKGITAIGNHLRGGEEGMYVNPARDAYMAGFQAEHGGSQFEALAKAFAESGIAGDVAERHIAMLYKADTMQEFNAATQKINEKLAEGKTAQEQMTLATTTASTAMTTLGLDTTALNAGFGMLAQAATAAAMALAAISSMPIGGGMPMAPGAVGGAPASPFQAPALDQSIGADYPDGAGGTNVTINAGTVIGNPDELAMMTLQAIEGGGDPFNYFRQMQQAAFEGA